jgi:hypothetical protein
MSNPKFSVGEAVMVRSIEAPALNSDFSIITDIFEDPFNVGVSAYFVHNRKFIRDQDDQDAQDCGVCESALRPIPPEKQNGIDASEWIKDRTGVTA